MWICSKINSSKRVEGNKYEDQGEKKFYSKVVALQMQMLDRKPTEDVLVTIEEDAGEYEAEAVNE